MNIAMFIFQTVCSLEQFVLPTRAADVYMDILKNGAHQV